MDKFKIRCSAIGKIMSGNMGLTEAQEKTLDGLLKKDKLTEKQSETLVGLEHKRDNPVLPQTAKSYCDMWLKEQIYNRKSEFSSKYTEKGNIVEDNSIDFIAEQLGFEVLFKNQDSFENEYMTGTPDVIEDGLIIDAKNPWSWETFPILDSRITNQDYFYQGQGYMNLTGLRSFKLCYVLSDTPEHLIEKEAFYYAKNNGYEVVDDEMLEEFRNKMTYGDIDDKFKFKDFDVEYDQMVVDEIISRVKACRKYIDSRVEELGL